MQIYNRNEQLFYDVYHTNVLVVFYSAPVNSPNVL